MKSHTVIPKAALAAALFALSCILTSAATVYAEGRLVDGIEAVVNGDVITMSELDRAVMVEAERLGMSSEDVGPEMRHRVLDSMIERDLLLAEARKFDIIEVSEGEVEAALDDIRERFGSEDELQKALEEQEMTLEELRESVRNQITALKYIDRRIRFFVRVTLDEQKKYYRENEPRFAGRPFEEVSEEIRSLLVEKRTNEKLDEYMKTLREKADIRFPSFGRSSPND